MRKHIKFEREQETCSQCGKKNPKKLYIYDDTRYCEDCFYEEFGKWDYINGEYVNFRFEDAFGTVIPEEEALMTDEAYADIYELYPEAV